MNSRFVAFATINGIQVGIETSRCPESITIEFSAVGYIKTVTIKI